MKLYGSRRRDTTSCIFKCCGASLARCLKHTKEARAARRGARKRARREWKKGA